MRDRIAHCLLRDGHERGGVPDRTRLRTLRDAEPGHRPDLVLMDYALPDTDAPRWHRLRA
ncbi:hypothetical protein [Nocardioides sp. HB32]